jgi:uncharacterized protein
MTRIGLLSDTHGFVDDRLLTFFEPCSEIWHAGDIGNIATAGKLSGFRVLRAVYGNIDGHELRMEYKLFQRFRCEDTNVLITHIGGYPGHYDSRVKEILQTNPPNLFICGHSHILKVIWDKKMNFLHINPGAAGNSGFHKVKTAVRFTIDGSSVKDLEIWESQR